MKDVLPKVGASILMVPCVNDPPPVQEGGEAEKVHCFNSPSRKIRSITRRFPQLFKDAGLSVEFKKSDQVHGFTVRGDVSDPAVKQAVEQAFANAVEFIKKVM